MGRTVGEIIPRLAPKLEAVLRRILESGEPAVNFEISGETIAAPGETRYWLANYYPVGAGARILGIGAVVIEITDQKRTEEALKAAQRRKDELLAIVSHDLRNPLGTISLNVELLAKNTSGDESGRRMRKWAETAKHAAERMQRLIADLLDMSSIEAGQLKIKTGRHPIDTLLNEAVQTFAQLAAAKSILLEAEQGPASEPPMSVLCDRDRILQVFSNLIGNAIKFTPERGSIMLRAERVDSSMRFSVRDTGVGVPEDQLPRLFDRYWKSEADRRGVGLGLYIARGIVEAHGGKMGGEQARSREHVLLHSSARGDRFSDGGGLA
jgi:signal transduction histidine kinase